MLYSRGGGAQTGAGGWAPLAPHFNHWSSINHKQLTLAAGHHAPHWLLTVKLQGTHKSSVPRRRLVTPPSECRWIAVLVGYAKWTFWPYDLDLWHFNPKSISLWVFSKVIPCTKFEHFRIIWFWVMLQTNKQTNRQTNRRSRSPDISGVGNEYYCTCLCH